MKLIKKVVTFVSLLGISSSIAIAPVSASESQAEISIDPEVIEVDVGQPVVFNDAKTIDDVVNEIDQFYLQQPMNFSGDIMPFAAPGTKWREGSVTYLGQDEYSVTNYFWVSGSNMSSLNVVGRAQRNAVIARYGSVNNNTSYQMRTTQIVRSSPQTQGYVTISAEAFVFSRD